jgi:hypothetical protein
VSDDEELCCVCFKDRSAGLKWRSMPMDWTMRLIKGPPLTLEERVFRTRPFCSYDCFKKARSSTT